MHKGNEQVARAHRMFVKPISSTLLPFFCAVYCTGSWRCNKQGSCLAIPRDVYWRIATVIAETDTGCIQQLAVMSCEQAIKHNKHLVWYYVHCRQLKQQLTCSHELWIDWIGKPTIRYEILEFCLMKKLQNVLSDFKPTVQLISHT